MLQRQSSSITTASPFYFTSTAMPYSTWSYKLTYSTRSLVREPLVIVRYPLVNYKAQVIRWLFFFRMLSARQHIRLLTSSLLVSILSPCQCLIHWLLTYPLLSNSACQHLIRLLASYPLVSALFACQLIHLLAYYPLFYLFTLFNVGLQNS